MKRLLIASIAGVCCFSGAAWANGLGEDRSWQFRTDSDRANLAVVLDVIERKKAGFYDGLGENTFVTNNNFAGDQINCTVQASAVGNQATNSQDGAAGNANITPAVANSASTIGNEATNSATGSSSQIFSSDEIGSTSTLTDTTNSGGSNNDGSDFSIGSDDNNTYSPGNASYSAQDLVNNDQSNNDSNLTSNANNNTNNVNVGDTSTSGEVTQTLNNNQDNSGNQTANVNNSQGCTFSE